MIQESTITLLHKTSATITKYDSIAKVTGENFNVFNVLGMGASEVRLHSALLAELINPKGKHGQGIIFFNHFLQTLEEVTLSNDITERLAKFTNNEIDVEVERWTGYILNEYSEGGYIDILITTKTGDAIIIENKIYANDQKGQLRRYHNYNKKAVLIYLTLDGKEASKETTFNDKYPDEIITPICVSYKNFVIAWLEKCKNNAVNHPLVRETITQYIYLLKQLTHQTTNHNMKKEIVDMVAQNSEFIRSAQEIWDNQEAIKLQIIRNLTDELKRYANISGWHFDTTENSGTLGKDDTGFGFKIYNKPYWVYYYFRGNYDNLEVGIDWAPNQNKDEVLRDKLRNHFQDFEYGSKLTFDDWIWGSKFQPWSKASWAEVQSVVPPEIIETTKIFLNKLESFKP